MREGCCRWCSHDLQRKHRRRLRRPISMRRSGSHVPIRYSGEAPTSCDPGAGTVRPRPASRDRRRHGAADAGTAVARAPADPDDARSAGLLARLLGRGARRHARALSPPRLAGGPGVGRSHQPRQAARQIALPARPRLPHKRPCAIDHPPGFTQSTRLRLNTLIRLRWLATVGQSVTVILVGLLVRLPAAGRPVLRADRLLGLAEPVPRLPLPGDPPAVAAGRACNPGLRRGAARRAAVSHRRTDQPVLPADDRAGRHLGHVAAAAHDGAAGRLRHGGDDAARLLPRAAALVSRADAGDAVPSISPACGWRWSPASCSRRSMPTAWPRRRACYPTRCRRPNWCCSASSTCRLWTGWRPRRPTNWARRSPRSRWSPRRWSGRWAAIHAFSEDVTLLRSQSERCREILKRLTSLSSESEVHLSRLPLTSLIEEVVAPHRDFGIAIRLEPGERSGPEPVGRRNPGVLYGLGNLVENAVDFARDTVIVRWRWDEESVGITIVDDGRASRPDILDRIGEPYMSTRQGVEGRRRAGARPVHRQDPSRALRRDPAVPELLRPWRGRGDRDRLAPRRVHGAGRDCMTAFIQRAADLDSRDKWIYSHQDTSRGAAR